jgi:hypothetical protein
MASLSSRVQLVLTWSGNGPRRYHVIERCQAIAPLREQVNAEILGMAVNRRQHPKEKLRTQKRGQIVIA